MRKALFLVLTLVTAAAQAEVYRCEREGRTVYTDKPCSKGARPMLIPETGYAGRPQAGRPTPPGRRAVPAKVRRQETAEDKAGRVLTGLSQGKVVKGMTPAQVRQILGEPDATSLQEGRENITIWSFRPEEGWHHTISFRGGEVNSVSSRRGRKKS